MVIGSVREIWRYPVKSMAGERLESSEVGGNGVWGDRGWALRDEETGEIHNAKRHPALLSCSARYRAEPRADFIPPVDITLPDGETVGSDSAEAPARLSELMGRRVALRPLQPAVDRKYYRRREAGTALFARLWAFRPARPILQRAMLRGRNARDLRNAFGLEAAESLPDLSEMPGTVWEFQTPPGTYFDVSPVHVVTTSTLRLMALRNPSADWNVRRFRPNVLLETGSAEGAVENGWVGRSVRIGGFVIRGDLLTVRCAMPMHPQKDLPRDPSVSRTILREAKQCLGLYASVIEPGRVRGGDPVEIVE